MQNKSFIVLAAITALFFTESVVARPMWIMSRGRLVSVRRQVSAYDITLFILADISMLQSSNIGDFGSCSVPQIEFGVGFDNRKETSFEPVDESK